MDIIGTLKKLPTLSKRVDEAMEIKTAVEELQGTVSALIERLQALDRLLKAFKGGIRD